MCYDPNFNSKYQILQEFDELDFCVGAVHWIDGFAYDHSKKHWNTQNIAHLYKRYYDVSIQLANSRWFDGIAHPDAIKCFGLHSKNDLTAQYEQLAIALYDENMYAENNVGVNINYGYRQEWGMNSQLRSIFKKHNVEVRTASDAHIPFDVGRYFRKIKDL